MEALSLVQRISTKVFSLVPFPHMAWWSSSAKYVGKGVIRATTTSSNFPWSSFLRSFTRSCENRFSLFILFIYCLYCSHCLYRLWCSYWGIALDRGWSPFNTPRQSSAPFAPVSRVQEFSGHRFPSSGVTDSCRLETMLTRCQPLVWVTWAWSVIRNG